MFIDTAQYIITNWLTWRGYTIGIGDTIADNKTMEKINVTISGIHSVVPKPIHLLISLRGKEDCAGAHY